MTGGKISGNTANTYPAIYGDVTFNNAAVIKIKADGTTVQTAVAKARMVSYNYIEPVMPAYDEYEIVPDTGYRPSSGGSAAPSEKKAVVLVVNGAKSGKLSTDKSAPKAGERVTITVTPDAGFEVVAVTVTDSRGNLISLTRNADGTYSFIQPSTNVTVAATFGEEKPDGKTNATGFSDVSEDAYYYKAVLWAVEKGVTTGTDATHFSPDAKCTRAQMVTFLWRAAGSPEPTDAAAFTDVKADAYYAKAVAWAAENGVTTGTGAGAFSPDETVTREQTVTFLFRAMKGAASGENPFADVAKDAFYTDAVTWAVANGITNGTSATTFGTADDCLRAQIVTFLYRAYGEK